MLPRPPRLSLTDTLFPSSPLLRSRGQCTPPDFASARPHGNPTGAQHGRENPMGAHHGALPNLVVETDQIGRATLHLVGSRFEGDGGLLDADGAAFVIRAGPDDYKSDPSGNSGGRVACGVRSEEHTSELQ